MVGERESEASGWSFLRKFPNAREARDAYDQTRDLILSDDLPASVFRFTVSRESFVAVLGDTALESRALQRINGLLEQGETAEVADEVLAHLRQRRQAFNDMPVEFLERRRMEE